MALRQGQPPHVCFYSNKCDWSEAFLKELRPTPYKGEFQFICVDGLPRSQLPDWVKQVPTLLIRGDEEPIKTNSEVMNWLFLRKLKENGNSSNGGNGGNGGSGGSANTGSGGPMAMSSGEPDAWNISEMGGKLSESYGVLIDGTGSSVSNSSTKNFDFGFLNGSAAVGDRTTQGMGDSGGARQDPSRTKTKKEDMMDKQMEAYMKGRDQGLPSARLRQGGAAPSGVPPGGSMGGMGPGVGEFPAMMGTR